MNYILFDLDKMQDILMSPQGHKLVLCTASPVFHQVGKYCIQSLWQRIRSMIPRYTYIQIYMLCNFEQKKYVDCSSTWRESLSSFSSLVREDLKFHAV